MFVVDSSKPVVPRKTIFCPESVSYLNFKELV